MGVAEGVRGGGAARAGRPWPSVSRAGQGQKKSKKSIDDSTRCSMGGRVPRALVRHTARLKHNANILSREELGVGLFAVVRVVRGEVPQAVRRRLRRCA